jgi:hypothetical protein
MFDTKEALLGQIQIGEDNRLELMSVIFAVTR